MKLQELITTIENIAPPHLAAAWDNGGMQVAALRNEVACLALCLDPSPASVRRALELGAQCIVSHHPLLMQGRLPHVVDDYHRVLSLLLSHDVPLYAAHTALDCNPQGPVGWLGRALALSDTAVLEPVGLLSTGEEGGYGLVGNLPHAYDHRELLQTLAQYISLQTATVCGDIPKTVTRVAYCTGSGASLVKAAYTHKAQIFITGDVKYHSAMETPICMWDVGHHSLEEVMMEHFARTLVAHIPTVRVEFVASASPFAPL